MTDIITLLSVYAIGGWLIWKGIEMWREEYA